MELHASFRYVSLHSNWRYKLSFAGCVPAILLRKTRKICCWAKEENKPHPGDAASGGSEPFEENHNASLMWQTFLRRLRPGVFASQNQKDLVSGLPNLFYDLAICGLLGVLISALKGAICPCMNI